MLKSAAVLALALIAGAAAARAESVTAYPDRTVRLIVAGAPGGNPDVLARLIAQHMSQAFDKSVIVETIPGSNSVLAARSMTSSAPDGYTVMLAESSMLAINPALFSDLPYRLSDFAPVAGLVTVPTVLAVPASLGAKTLPDFVGLAKSRLGSLNYGSGGPGSIHHLTMAVFAARAGLQMTHVPYRGGSALVNGLMTGEIQAGWSGIPPAQSLIDSGNLLALCISTAQRSATLPNVPAAAELGYPGFDYATTIGLVALAGTPPSIVAKLQDAAGRAMRDLVIIERLKTLGMESRFMTAPEYASFIKADAERYGAVIKELNIRIK